MVLGREPSALREPLLGPVTCLSTAPGGCPRFRPSSHARAAPRDLGRGCPAASGTGRVSPAVGRLSADETPSAWPAAWGREPLGCAYEPCTCTHECAHEPCACAHEPCTRATHTSHAHEPCTRAHVCTEAAHTSRAHVHVSRAHARAHEPREAVPQRCTGAT